MKSIIIASDKEELTFLEVIIQGALVFLMVTFLDGEVGHLHWGIS